jgi:predicted kinase
MSGAASRGLLVILGGLPGVGKTSLARELALATGATHLRIDTIEQALRDTAVLGDLADVGYRVAYALATDNLRLGRTVIGDSVNALAITRQAWRATAARAGAVALEVEVICSDPELHRARLAARPDDIPGMERVSWNQVLSREYEPWDNRQVTVDTARQDLAAGVAAIRAAMRG